MTAWRPGWSWRHLLLAPHRLGFFLATVVLGASSLWWAAHQLDRSGAGPGLALAVSPAWVHASLMTYGFIPLFFTGFLFTAGPKWLQVKALPARQLAPPMLAQAGGWLLWLVTSHFDGAVATAALTLAAAGHIAVTAFFWQMVRASQATDRLHARIIGSAMAAGCIGLIGFTLAVAAGMHSLARAFVLSGLWGFIVVVFMTAAHRLIPFFTSDAVPMRHAWHPLWVLWVVLGAAVFEVLAAWVEAAGRDSPVWTLGRALVELVAAGVVVWLASAWGVRQRPKTRLLAMLHLGFLWLGLGWGLGGLSQLLGLLTGAPVLPLAALHAVTMGCLGSLMFAMVTRITCGFHGRPQVADNLVWCLFWALQMATLLRIAAAVPSWPGQMLVTAASGLWAGLFLVWGARHGLWYGRLRADGRPG